MLCPPRLTRANEKVNTTNRQDEEGEQYGYYDSLSIKLFQYFKGG